MKNSRLVKAITLLSFVSLLTAFVAYRSGTFNEKGLSANRSSGFPVDSPPFKPTIMSSSKSGRIVHTNDDQKSNDSIQQNTNESTIQGHPAGSPYIKEEKTIMSSSKSMEPLIISGSKSAPIFFPKKDSTKKKK